MTTYVALIHKDADSDYGVSFPDLPGCITAGVTLDEALSMAKEALALHIEGLLEENQDVPASTPIDQLDRDDAALVAAIEVPDNLRVERINITVPALVLRRIDAFAERRGMTRSGLFVEAAQQFMLKDGTLEEQTLPRILGLIDTLRETTYREVLIKRGDTSISTLRAAYDAEFARGIPGEEKLINAFRRLDAYSLRKLEDEEEQPGTGRT